MASLLQFSFFLNIPPVKIKIRHVNQILKLSTEGTKSSAQDQKIFIFKNKYLCTIFAACDLRAVLKAYFVTGRSDPGQYSSLKRGADQTHNAAAIPSPETKRTLSRFSTS